MFRPEKETPDPVLEVDATGMGMTVIRRELLEDPNMRLGEDSDCDSPAIFRTPRALNGKLLATEDIDFCGHYLVWTPTFTGWTAALSAAPSGRYPE